ncbi:MAG: hypothetical protein FJ143_00160 [Deltaproteobacteria bacterium]|nr:hypothetical protein [Deltaproteobacteria bacterium]
MAQQKTRSPKQNPLPPTRAARDIGSLREAAWFVAAALAVSFYLHFSSDKFADPDIFYHFRHAALYAANGPFDAAFPWARYSVIGQHGADIWYGFHLLLIPFVWLGDPLLAMRLAGALATTAFLFSVFHACRQLEIKAAPLWPMVLLFSSAFLLHRLTMLRPQVLSLGLSMLMLPLITAGQLRATFLVAGAAAWLHLSLFFVPLIVFAVFAALKLATDKTLPCREGLALAGGLAAGWLLRPNPLGAAKIVYVQVFQWTLEKLAGAPLEVGSELRPLTIAIHSNYLPFIVVSLAALGLLLWKSISRQVALPARQRTCWYSAAILSLGFLLLAVLFARRAFDFTSAFGMIVIALAVSQFLTQPAWLRVGLLGLFVVLALYGLSLRDRVLSVGWQADRAAAAAKWLEANSKPGDLVFNTRWEYFAELFFWNTKNHYVGGMDPIFQYAYDPELYRTGLSLGAARNSLFCPAGACPEPSRSDSHRLLKDKFKARYVFLLKQPDANLFLALLGDRRFALRHHDEQTALFEVL